MSSDFLGTYGLKIVCLGDGVSHIVHNTSVSYRIWPGAYCLKNLAQGLSGTVTTFVQHSFDLTVANKYMKCSVLSWSSRVVLGEL